MGLFFVAIALFSPILLSEVAAHGYLKDPIARTSIQLRPEFNTQQPYWWDNTGVWCNNAQQDMSYSTCGRCGEGQGNSDASQGGIYDKNVIVANWTSGSIVNIVANFQAAHHGYYQVELCASATESNGCFTTLQIVGGSEQVRDGNRLCVPYDNNATQDLIARVQLPSGVRCDRCTIRWTYRTSYPGPAGWESCDNPRPAQTFRNCADVRIQ
jgi:hypothetical protein